MMYSIHIYTFTYTGSDCRIQYEVYANLGLAGLAVNYNGISQSVS